MKHILSLLVVFFFIMGTTGTAAVLPLPKGSGDDNVQIDADKFEVDKKTGWVTARDNVKVKTGTHELTADRVRLNQESGDVQARGNVIIREVGFGTWTGNYIEYNYKTGKGMTGSSETKAGPFRVFSDEMTKAEDGKIEAHNLCFTTCTNAPGHWHWCMRGDGEFKYNDYVEVFNAVPYLFGVPFAWLPYWYRDLDTHYGFRIMPGYTSKWGAYLLTGYVYDLYDAPQGKGPKLYASTSVDLRTKRGAAAGQNIYWDLNRWGTGHFESYYARDTDPPDDWDDRNWVSDVNEDRYRFRLFHSADVTPRDQFLLRGTYVSDSDMSSDFFHRDDRNESSPMNFLSWEHREHSLAFGATASGPLNDFYAGNAYLPEGWLNIMPQPLAFGINYESQTRAGYLNRQYAKYGDASNPDFCYYPGEWADFNTVRVDTSHRLTYPMKFDDWLSVVPRAGYRGTYYSDADGETDVYRHTADLGMEVSTRATSAWENNRRHIFEPYIDYSFQPTHETWGKSARTYSYDRLDNTYGWLDQFGMDGVLLPYDWHGIRPGVRNVIQTRDIKGKVRSLLDWDLFSAIQFQDDTGHDDDTGVRLLGTKLRYAPTEDFLMRAHSQWDTQEDKLAYTDLGAMYKITEKIHVGGGYFARDHRLYDYDESPCMQWNRAKENLIYGGFTHEINDTWSWSTYVRYDTRANELDEVGGYLQYQLDCLIFQIRTAYQTSFDRIDGTERDDDFRVSFTMWLRAEGDKQKDEWMRW